MIKNYTKWRIGIVANIGNEKAIRIKDELLEKLFSKNITAQVFNDKIMQAQALKEFSSTVDLIFAIGGDGTLLSILRSCGKNNIPVIGINAGRKGFLAEISVDELDFAIDKILAGDFSIEERLMLQAKIFDKHNNIVSEDIIAVNDFNIARHGYARMIKLEVQINDQLAERFDADGILVSSPTGSTAYSLSAGGPIILPGIECILITPVCSHSLHARPMIAPKDVKIKIVAKDQLHDVATTVDGQSLISIPISGHIEITKSEIHEKQIFFHSYLFGIKSVFFERSFS